jgi:hypothetical protein
VGIVTAFDFAVDEVGDVGFAQLAFDASDTVGFLQAWGDWVVDAPARPHELPHPRRRATGGAARRAGHGGRSTPTTPTRAGALQPLAEAAPLVAQDVRITSYRAVISNVRRRRARRPRASRPRAPGSSAASRPSSPATPPGSSTAGATYFFQLRAVGGAVHDVPADATAFAHRSAEFSVVAFGSSRQGTSERWTSSSGRTSTAPT